VAVVPIWNWLKPTDCPESLILKAWLMVEPCKAPRLITLPPLHSVA
jgi:hypothetical protein